MSKYKRILQISDDHEQITLPDSRYYRRNGEFYPSITYLLSYYPKGKYYEEWLKKVGYSSDYLAKKAAEEGGMVHDMIEKYLDGEEITFLNDFKQPKMEYHVWKMFLRFVDFWETYKPTLIEREIHLFSDKYKVAGTCDLVCEIEINGEKQLWIIDHKTSNQLIISYEIQTAIYAQCWKECFGVEVDKVGILWLKAKTRGPDKKGKNIQGKGWIIKESSRNQEDNMKIFEAVKTIFDTENPKHEPATETFPISIKKNN